MLASKRKKIVKKLEPEERDGPLTSPPGNRWAIGCPLTGPSNSAVAGAAAVAVSEVG